MTDERRDPRLDAFAVDVRELMERSVASLYSHLVTRPTGRAVREAIERQLDDLCGPTLSLVDLSAVAILDYSCADEVVAKLLLRYGRRDGRNAPAPAPFFVLRGVRDHHREPIEAVLERHELAVVAETARGRFEPLGRLTRSEYLLWEQVERRRRVSATAVVELVGDPSRLDRLIVRGLLFRDPLAGDLHALSTLVESTGPTGDNDSTPGNQGLIPGV